MKKLDVNEIEELATAILKSEGINVEDDDFDLDQELYKKFEIDFYKFDEIINSIWSKITIGISPLTSQAFIGISEPGEWIVKREYHSEFLTAVLQFMDAFSLKKPDNGFIRDVVSNGILEYELQVKKAPVFKSKGLELINKERKRQIEVEGYSLEKDSKYFNNELADAAICYLVDPQYRDSHPFPWPWDESSFKPSSDNRIKDLSKAGALIAAEIDRLSAINDIEVKGETKP